MTNQQRKIQQPRRQVIQPQDDMWDTFCKGGDYLDECGQITADLLF